MKKIQSLKNFFGKNFYQWYNTREKKPLEDSTIFYLSQNLSNPSLPEGYLGFEKAAGILLAEAVDIDDVRACAAALEDLLVATTLNTTVFEKSLEDSPVGLDYYRNIGTLAAGKLAGMHIFSSKNKGQIFYELYEKYNIACNIVKKFWKKQVIRT